MTGVQSTNVQVRQWDLVRYHKTSSIRRKYKGSSEHHFRA